MDLFLSRSHRGATEAGFAQHANSAFSDAAPLFAKSDFATAPYLWGKVPVFSAMLLICCALFAGCERKIKDSNLAAVKSDMTTKEVESVLGPPSRVETPTELKSQEVVTMKVTRYIYEQNGKKVELLFVGDRLASGGVTGSFEK